MTYKLKFKKRGRSKIYIPKSLADEILATGQIQLFVETLRTISAQPDYFHDKDHMEMIINWSPPQQGIPFIDAAQWVRLALRVADIDPAQEPTLSFTEQEKMLLYKKLRDNRFSVFGVNTHFYEFVHDLEQAFGEQIHLEAEEAATDEKTPEK